MNLSTIPSDNLYKFMSIFGLVLIVSCMTAYMLVHDSWTEQTYKLELKIKEMDVKTKHQSDSIELFDIDSCKANPKDCHDNFEKIEKTQREQEIDNSQLIVLNKYLNERLKEITSYSYALFFLTLFGFLISTVGFILWYYKLQIYQDALIIKEYKKQT
ncbi:MAG: hypothetical protein WC667_06895 [Sulfurimonas sp.]|jgi:hypothetical protein